MPLFRRRKRDDPARPGEPRRSTPPSPGRSPSAPYDWRSYDDVAEEYARTHAPYTVAVAADLVALAGAREGSRVLDVGTGTGDALPRAEEIVGASGVAIGVDSAPGMLRVARSGRVAAAEVINLPFRADAFDVAMLNFSLPYFTKLDTALFDVRRVLRPGGTLVASTWGADEDDLSRTWRELVEASIGRDILKAGLKDEAPWAEKLADPKALEAVLRDAGLRPVTVERRRYRFEISRDDYIRGHEIEASGRYTRAMLGDRLWEGFRARVRSAFEERFPERLVDFRDVLLATAGNPER